MNDSTYAPPEGYEFDPSTGLYYSSAMGSDPATGAPVQWVTWFDANSGEYNQVSYPASQPQPVYQTPIINNVKTPQPVNRKTLKIIMISVLVAALLGGGIFAFLHFGGMSFFSKSSELEQEAGQQVEQEPEQEADIAAAPDPTAIDDFQFIGTIEEIEKRPEEEMEETQRYPAPRFDRVEASKTLGPNYSPELTQDGRQDTAWAYSGSGPQAIVLHADTVQYVSGIKILNGYTKYRSDNGWLYYLNNRPKEVIITFSDGTEIIRALVDAFDEGNYLYQDLDLGETIATTFVKIAVNGVYPGTLWDDTCITEILVY